MPRRRKSWEGLKISLSKATLFKYLQICPPQLSRGKDLWNLFCRLFPKKKWSTGGLSLFAYNSSIGINLLASRPSKTVNTYRSNLASYLYHLLVSKVPQSDRRWLAPALVWHKQRSKRHWDSNPPLRSCQPISAQLVLCGSFLIGKTSFLVSGYSLFPVNLHSISGHPHFKWTPHFLFTYFVSLIQCFIWYFFLYSHFKICVPFGTTLNGSITCSFYLCLIFGETSRKRPGLPCLC